jgi:hypothetical protein
VNRDSYFGSILWIASEIFYYLGLVSAALFLPALAFILWMMSLVGRADPDYGYILIAWIVSVLVFIAGIGLKNLLCSESE